MKLIAIKDMCQEIDKGIQQLEHSMEHLTEPDWVMVDDLLKIVKKQAEVLRSLITK